MLKVVFSVVVYLNTIFLLYHECFNSSKIEIKINLLTKAVFTEHVIDNLKSWINSTELLYEKHIRVSSLFNHAFTMVAEHQSNGLIVTTLTRCNFVLVTSNVLKSIRGSLQF
jgi:hypothetical protein